MKLGLSDSMPNAVASMSHDVFSSANPSRCKIKILKAMREDDSTTQKKTFSSYVIHISPITFLVAVQTHWSGSHHLSYMFKAILNLGGFPGWIYLVISTHKIKGQRQVLAFLVLAFPYHPLPITNSSDKN